MRDVSGEHLAPAEAEPAGEGQQETPETPPSGKSSAEQGAMSPPPLPSAPPPPPASAPPVPPPPAARPPVSSQLPPAVPGYQPGLAAISEAHKQAKYAVSSLSFEDVPTAVKHLTQALRILTSPPQ